MPVSRLVRRRQQTTTKSRRQLFLQSNPVSTATNSNMPLPNTTPTSKSHVAQPMLSASHRALLQQQQSHARHYIPEFDDDIQQMLLDDADAASKHGQLKRQQCHQDNSQQCFSSSTTTYLKEPQICHGAPIRHGVSAGPLPLEWEEWKVVMEEYYINRACTLAQLTRIMEVFYEFRATGRMYKRRFSQWQWWKYDSKGFRKHHGDTGQTAHAGKSRSGDFKRPRLIKSKKTRAPPLLLSGGGIKSKRRKANVTCSEDGSESDDTIAEATTSRQQQKRQKQCSQGSVGTGSPIMSPKSTTSEPTMLLSPPLSSWLSSSPSPSPVVVNPCSNEYTIESTKGLTMELPPSPTSTLNLLVSPIVAASTTLAQSTCYYYEPTNLSSDNHHMYPETVATIPPGATTWTSSPSTTLYNERSHIVPRIAMDTLIHANYMESSPNHQDCWIMPPPSAYYQPHIHPQTVGAEGMHRMAAWDPNSDWTTRWVYEQEVASGVKQQQSLANVYEYYSGNRFPFQDETHVWNGHLVKREM